MEDFIKSRLTDKYTWSADKSTEKLTGPFDSTDGDHVVTVLKHMFSIRVFWNNEKALSKMEACLRKLPVNKFNQNEVVKKLIDLMDSL